MSTAANIIRAGVFILATLIFTKNIYADPYEFTSNGSLYTVDNEFFTVNSLVDGFTVASGAVVIWNTDQAVSGAATVAADATFNIVPGGTFTGNITKGGYYYILSNTLLDTDPAFNFTEGFIVGNNTTVTLENTTSVYGNVIIEEGSELLVTDGYEINNWLSVIGRVTKNGKPYVVHNTTITEDNVMDYTAGFTVGNNATVTWNATSATVNGPIIVEHDAKIVCSQQPTLGGSGSATKNGLPYIVHNTEITDSFGGNSGDYTPGFYVASGVVVTWNAEAVVTGPVVVEDGAELDVNGYFNVDTQGSGSITGSVGTIFKNGLPYILNDVTVSDDGGSDVDSPTGYTNGFTIGNNATVTWASSAVVTGNVTIENGSTLDVDPGIEVSGWGTVTGKVTKNGLPYVVNPNVTIRDVTDYLDGFRVGNNVTVVWDVDDSVDSIAGDVAIETGSILNVTNHFKIDVSNSITGSTIKNSLPYILNDVTINDPTADPETANSVDCSAGFTIGNNATVTWNSSNITPSGNVVVEGGSALVVTPDIEISGWTGTVTGNVTKNSHPYILSTIEIVDGTYNAGFIIGNSTTVTWNTDDQVTGPVTVEDGAVLGLSQSMDFSTAAILTVRGIITLGEYSITKNSHPYIYEDKVINNSSGYTDGFSVGNAAAVNWNASGAVTGPVVIEAGSRLDIASSIEIVDWGTITGNVYKNSLLYIVSPVTIVDDHAGNFIANGFTVGNGVTATWNNTWSLVAGPVIVEAGATLELTQPLNFIAPYINGPDAISTETLTLAGTLTLTDGNTITKGGKPYIYEDTQITNGDYATGFTVGNRATVTWSGSNSFDGLVFVESGATLQVNESMAFTTTGKLIPQGTVTIGSGKTITKNNKPYIVNNLSISALNPRNHTNGFTVASGKILEWNSAAAVNGPVVIENGGSITFTNPLILGIGGSIAKNDLPYLIKNTTVTNDNISTYVNGFTVGGGATVTWDSDIPVDGKVVVEPGSSIKEKQQFNLTGHGLLIKNGLPYVIHNLTISNDNFDSYAYGFSVGPDVTIDWRATTPVDGDVLVDAEGFILFNQPLNLASGKSLLKNGLPYLFNTVTINNSYTEGFTLASGGHVIWNYNNQNTPITGPVVIEDGGTLSSSNMGPIVFGTNGTIKLYGESDVTCPLLKNGFAYIPTNTVINDDTYGFIVPNGVTVTWDMSDSLAGNIVVEKGGILAVTNLLNIGTGSSVDGFVTKNGLPYIVNDVTITDANVQELLAGTVDKNGYWGTVPGFTIASGATLNWHSFWKADGPVVVENGGICNLNCPIVLGPNGSLAGTFFKNGLPYIVDTMAVESSDDGSSYAAGFTVANGAQFNWDNETTINGPIVIESGATFYPTQLSLGDNATINIAVDGDLNEIPLTKNGLTYFGMTTEITGGTNTETYVDGFTVASGAVVTLSSGTATITGPITVEKGGFLNVDQANTSFGNIVVNGTLNIEPGASLSLDTLTVGSSGIITEYSGNLYSDNPTKNGVPYIIKNTEIGTNSGYENGFTVADNAVATIDTSIAMTGNIIIEKGGVVPSNTITKNGLPYIVQDTTITDVEGYTNGFYVASGVVVNWQAIGDISGPVVVEQGALIKGKLTKDGLPYVVNHAIVNSYNVGDYLSGFYLAQGASINWAANYAYVSGPITLEDGSIFCINRQLALSNLVNNGTIIVGSQGSILQKSGSLSGTGRISQGGAPYNVIQ